MKQIASVMTKSLYLLGACCVLAAFANCGVSPKQACKDVVVAFCKKTIECVSEDARKLDPNLKDQATCEAAYTSKNNCDKDDICLGVADYNGSKALACIGEYNALTCGEVSGGSYEAKIPSCGQVCQ